ncbi:MAG TPA: hypothetical protein VF351_00480 [Actinomycetota bacterium]
MTLRARARPTGFRRFERWMIGVVFAVMAFVLEKFVMRSVRKKGEPPITPDDATTVVTKGGDVEL